MAGVASFSVPTGIVDALDMSTTQMVIPPPSTMPAVYGAFWQTNGGPFQTIALSIGGIDISSSVLNNVTAILGNGTLVPLPPSTISRMFYGSKSFLSGSDVITLFVGGLLANGSRTDQIEYFNSTDKSLKVASH